MQEICTCSGGMSDNGTRRGRGMVRKWMDGRIVKEDATERGMHSTVSWIFCTTETFDGGPSAISLRIQGESSQGSCVAGVEGRSQGAGGVEKKELGSLELGRGRSGGGLIGGLEVPLADVWEGKTRLRGEPDVLS